MKKIKKFKKFLVYFIIITMVTLIMPIKTFASQDGGTTAASITTTTTSPAIEGNSNVPDVNTKEYDEWKWNVVNGNSETSNKSTTYEVIGLRSASALLSTINNNVLSNEFIEFAVATNGRFTLGTTGGNPDTLNDNNKLMLYGHPNPGTSYTTLRINDINYIYGDGIFTLNPTFDKDNNSNISEQKFGDIKVKQVLSIVKNSATDRDDVLEIKYVVTNVGTTSPNIGTRIMMDTMLGNNDAAPFRVPGYGSVTTEM